jgi:hypothetical protein
MAEARHSFGEVAIWRCDMSAWLVVLAARQVEGLTEPPLTTSRGVCVLLSGRGVWERERKKDTLNCSHICDTPGAAFSRGSRRWHADDRRATFAARRVGGKAHERVTRSTSAGVTGLSLPRSRGPIEQRSLTLSLCVSLSVAFSVALSLCRSVTLSLCLSVSLSPYLSVSLSISVSLSPPCRAAELRWSRVRGGFRAHRKSPT